MKTERKIEILLKFVKSEITHNSNKAYSIHCDVDYAVEQESTADGYEVYTFKHPEDEICLSENIYYYDNDLPEVIVEALLDGECLLYIDEYLYEDLGIEEQLEESFVEYVEDIIKQEDIEKKNFHEYKDILTKKELKELKEEYYVEDKE
jgi:hypothetical protein